MWVGEEVGYTEKLANTCNIGETFKENLRFIENPCKSTKGGNY